MTLIAQGYTQSDIVGVGHRVIHGGDRFVAPTVINEDVEESIEATIELAPLHNPDCLAGIIAARKHFQHCPHIAVFDTAFHATLPIAAKLYALPETVSAKHNLRRFGFHGISHEYVTDATADCLQTPITELRIISCHLGNGCSIAAVEGGRSVETSMGMTPLEGLVMGKRCGDIDAGVVLKLLHDCNGSVEQLDNLLNRESGLLGMTGTNDMRIIEQRAQDGDQSCRNAIQLFSHRVRKYLGAYAAVMGGVDAITFTGGIGENSALIRHRVLRGFDFLGAKLDEDRNQDAEVNELSPIVDVSDSRSRVKLLVIATDEEAAIAAAMQEVIQDSKDNHLKRPIPVAVSARHVHLTEETIAKLFGPNYSLTIDHPLSQPGQYAAQETVSLVGPLKQIDDVRIIGPSRSKNQVEISRSDEFALGLDAPIRQSGNTEHTPGIKLLGSVGEVALENGVICAQRHIHMHPDDAKRYDVQDGDFVDVEISGSPRDLTFGDVLIRVSDRYKLEMHIDTDEANAAELIPHDTAIKAKIVNHH